MVFRYEHENICTLLCIPIEQDVVLLCAIPKCADSGCDVLCWSCCGVTCCVLATGDYPESLKACGGDNLPKFTPEESAMLKGSTDFLGINFYTGK
jgi:hypothetical protein